METLIQEKIQYSGELESDVVHLQQLDKANLVIDQFIRRCSHSMRGPLKSIRGLVNLLKDGNSDTEMDPAMVMKFIEESTDKMENMLDELEQFMLNSTKETKIKSVDLDELILQVTTSFQRAIKSEAIDVTVQVEQSGPFYSDSGRIRLILCHLLMNAITFQQKDNADKKIRIRCSVDPAECILSVEDNGIGIETDQHENIFKLFYQATGNSHGAGIGLFVVREALEKMGSTITVDSEPGQGSIFKFTLPNLAVKMG